MSNLEVIHHFPSQRRTLLSSIRAMDPEESNPITFNLDYFKEKVSQHLAFQIQFLVGGKKNHRIVLDEVTSTYVMSFPCWRDLGSPTLTTSPTTLKTFDGRGFQRHELLQYFTVTLKGKTVSIDIKVVDAPMNHNLLLSHSWFYAMTLVASSMFRILQFPHQGKFVIVDQLDYIAPNIHNFTVNNVPFLGHSSLESVGICILKDSLLMGDFSLPVPATPRVSTLNMISTQVQQSL